MRPTESCWYVKLVYFQNLHGAVHICTHAGNMHFCVIRPKQMTAVKYHQLSCRKESSGSHHAPEKGLLSDIIQCFVMKFMSQLRLLHYLRSGGSLYRAIFSETAAFTFFTTDVTYCRGMFAVILTASHPAQSLCSALTCYQKQQDLSCSSASCAATSASSVPLLSLTAAPVFAAKNSVQ